MRERCPQGLCEEFVPVRTRAERGHVHGFEDLERGGAGRQVESRPLLALVLGREAQATHPTLGESAEVVEESVGDAVGVLLDGRLRGDDVQRVRDVTQTLAALHGESDLATRDRAEREHHLVRVHRLRRRTRGHSAKHARHRDELDASSAHATRALGADAAWPPLAHSAARALETEAALRRLGLEAVHDRLDAGIGQVTEHLFRGGIRDARGIARRVRAELAPVGCHGNSSCTGWGRLRKRAGNDRRPSHCTTASNAPNPRW